MPDRPIILLVDDNSGDRLLMADALEAAGLDCHLVEADNAVKAFDYVTKRAEHHDAPTPDLILLDLNLPVIHGHRVLATLKADARFAGIPVMIFSSSGRKEDVEQSRRLGAHRHIVKPPTWNEYVAIARSLREDWLALSARAS